MAKAMTDDDTTPITRLQDARALKQLGLSLNTPVNDQQCSEAYSRHWLALMNAHMEFMNAVCEYSDAELDAVSPCLWQAGRRLEALQKAAGHCVDFVAELGGDVPAGAEPVFKSDQDATEYALLRWFVAERAIPFIDFWANAIITIAEGNGLTIRPEDVPPWTDED